MSGDNDAIKFQISTILQPHARRGGIFAHFNDLCGKANRIEGGEDFFHVGLRSPTDGEPRIMSANAKEAVVLKKTNETERREFAHFSGLGGPYR